MTSILAIREPTPIPRKLHQVWVGSTPPPWVYENWARWVPLLPDWEINYWTDANAEEWPLSSRLAGRCKHPAILADLVRLEQVSKYGGIYIDSDTRALRSLEPLAGDRRPWVAPSKAYGEAADSKSTLNNAAFGMYPGHPLLAAVWANAQRRARNGLLTSRAAGPHAWEAAVLTLEDSEQIEELDPLSFTGVRLAERQRVTSMSTADLFRRFPDTYAIHEFDLSWNAMAHSVHEAV